MEASSRLTHTVMDVNHWERSQCVQHWSAHGMETSSGSYTMAMNRGSGYAPTCSLPLMVMMKVTQVKTSSEPVFSPMMSHGTWGLRTVLVCGPSQPLLSFHFSLSSLPSLPHTARWKFKFFLLNPILPCVSSVHFMWSLWWDPFNLGVSIVENVKLQCFQYVLT